MNDTNKMPFTYVYLLKSQSGNNHYTSLTNNLKSRLTAHNTGKVPSAAKHRPWQIQVALAFRNPERAANFERYLKTHSGRAFAKKRL